MADNLTSFCSADQQGLAACFSSILIDWQFLEMDGLTNQIYDVATFTAWSATLRDRLQARSVHLFERGRWLAEGDSRCVERISRALGWQGELPAPFAMTSNRRFDLPPGTIAIHPGCKYEWPWKKWHGFAELATLFAPETFIGLANRAWPPNFAFPSQQFQSYDQRRLMPMDLPWQVLQTFRSPSPRGL